LALPKFASIKFCISYENLMHDVSFEIFALLLFAFDTAFAKIKGISMNLIKNNYGIGDGPNTIYTVI
jgi:hypothetical protein